MLKYELLKHEIIITTVGSRPDLVESSVGRGIFIENNGVGLLNQNMLEMDDEISDIEYDEDLETIVVRTVRETNYEDKLKKKTRTSGCAQGTVFGDLMDKFEENVSLNVKSVFGNNGTIKDYYTGSQYKIKSGKIIKLID